MRGRRLQEDALLDTADEVLRRKRCVLRIRTEGCRNQVTFKGPVQPSPLKVREEIETVVGDADALMSLFDRLGYRPWFRYQKYREEYAYEDVVVAIDETPVGVFIELEGGERGIEAMAALLGRGPGDYICDSYRTIFLQYCSENGVSPSNMVFEQS